MDRPANNLLNLRTLSSGYIIFTSPWRFKDFEEEKLYIMYTVEQKHRIIPRMLAVAALLQAFSAIVPGERNLYFTYTYLLIAFVLNLILAAMYIWGRCRCLSMMYLTWFFLWLQILIGVGRRQGDSYNELLGWAVILQYSTIAALPLHYIVLISYSLMSATSYVVAQYYSAHFSGDTSPKDFLLQQIANVMLLFAATLLGVTAYIVNEKQQRRSFQQTKKSLRDKLTIEKESKEQERLLLSVLPEHVAVQMRKDLGLIDTQFKKIYMSRHENVSILYADIVGFTAISSTYSAQDLVAILNELFARFDRLAEKYQQLRIKILGDCYYCISGAPVEHPKHAVLCVHMGLSMVKAIKYVQQTTNSPVDMRVGIHTGAVLAGVLGQRQWQFDVYSRDVELANKMESSGMAGRVHISEVTLGFLDDEFEVEPAYGERREEMLRQAGIKTYFIVRVKAEQGGEEKNAPVGEVPEGCEAADTLSDLHDDDEDSVLSPQDDKDNQGQRILNMLREELGQRDDDKELEDTTTACLAFKDPAEEVGYEQRRDPCFLSVCAPPLYLLPSVMVVASFATPTSWELNSIYIAYVVESGLANILFYVFFRYAQYKKMKLNPRWKLTCGAFNVALFVATNIIPLMICGQYEALLLDQGDHKMEQPYNEPERCMHPSYFYHLAAAVACSVLWLPVNVGYRALLLLGVAVVHMVPTMMYPVMLRSRPSIDHNPYQIGYNTTMEYNDNLLIILSNIHNVRNLLMLFFIALALFTIDRFTDSLDRAQHSRGQRMRAQAEQASDLRRRNQALIHNVLPPHVAKHFMGARHHHRDLYSQSYAEVGVLFASMPNFTEFYSEETVNNQGLECLRFLNEVISDFDLLLEEEKFKDIIKIKTIGSTYMAASGLNPKRVMKPSDGVTVRWAHLACLVEFALELQRVLAGINEQSFNHFVLRMGVNHGPITAGVIGARKPHYDIWGNTVNVASRMESTGKAGCIQVTEETCQILQNFDYYFEQRGLVAVKGKGQLMTYYLQGKRDQPNGPVEKYNNIEKGLLEPGASEALPKNRDTEAKNSAAQINDSNSDTPYALAKDVDPLHAMAKDTYPLHAPAKDTDPLHTMSKDDDPLHAPAKDTDPLHAMSNDTDPLHAMSNDTDPLHAMFKDTETLDAVAKETDPLHVAADDKDDNVDNGPLLQ